MSQAALNKGGKQINPRTILLDRGFDCLAPVSFWQSARKDRDINQEQFLQIEQRFPCRKCRVCLERKRKGLTRKLNDFCSVNEELQFVTLTEDPRINLVDWPKEVQRYIKRVRHYAGAFMYAWTLEYQARGALHAHILMYCEKEQLRQWMIKGHYELTGYFPRTRVRKDDPTLNGHSVTYYERWPWGFSHVERLEINTEHAGYLMKYITKDPEAKVRSSHGLRVFRKAQPPLSRTCEERNTDPPPRLGEDRDQGNEGASAHRATQDEQGDQR